MLINIDRDTRGEHRRLLVAGVGFLVTILVLVGISIAMYQKRFTSFTTVTVHADQAGLQLAKFGDVRMHGVLVGRVHSISHDGHQAVIDLDLSPSAAKSIPDNVRVEIQPTTLFGQKFVSLVAPAAPSAKALSDGTVIPASRVTTNVELEKILADLFPLLRTIRPADLNATLYALSSALAGKGEKIGQTLSDLDQYLTTMNTHLPTVRKDLVLLAKVSKTYSLATPDLVRLLKNATTTARTVSSREKELHGFFLDLTGLAKTGTRVLTRNEQGIVREGQLAVPLTRLLDTYSPEYACLLKGTDRYTGRLAQIFGTNRVVQTMSLNSKQNKAYTAADRPKYGEIGHGPWCMGLPVPRQGDVAPLNLKDGYQDGQQ